ncbi:hypothetical protein COLO4_02216 [Corchorus olitorius]|uniref:Uncharacterized protein n=1 Tax=Corchorus olitorius TaxID=93759 RepID=A0A1R3L1B6_9ROSI|nr:hypothetical protein COLO4_02216 [Corchorus olitorius]
MQMMISDRNYHHHPIHQPQAIPQKEDSEIDS